VPLRNSVRVFSSLACLLLAPALAQAVIQSPYVTVEAADARFGIVVDGAPLPLVVSGEDHPGVVRVAKLLQTDFERVSGEKPQLEVDGSPPGKQVILIGTLGKSPVIDQLVRGKKLDASELAGKWEKFIVQTVEQPMDGVDRALVIAGSDKRGTIFGMFDLAQQMGVSPWHFWADVPVRRQKNLYVLSGTHTDGEPAVKYRGIFINDEAPALSGWAHEKFGGFNAKFYDHVFELILRLRGNYLWPAMWGRAIYDDDPNSPKLADEYGVVIGTSHHEPLMRAHVEWDRYGKGPWNYDKNEAVLREFWADGIRRMGTNESIVTIGMRGDGDEPMTESANIDLLERIVHDQRDIIATETGRDPAEQPQLWALYKEVQEYYDRGMRVPDDVTLLLCDDNWGNIRKLPKPSDPPRPGGYGIYYHFDYVGGPRNYKWLNTNPLPRIWEQMHLAYEHGVDRIWIVNVGDIKPMELPIEFFLDYAWDPDRWPADKLGEYTRLWAAQQFGETHAAEIADILAKYLKYNARRKPELLTPDTYSLANFREAERVVEEYNALAERARQVNEQLPAEDRDAFFQLVLYPVEACANLNELYVAAARNRLYAKQGRAATNELAERVQELFEKDAELSRYYNRDLAGGKWSHMADQTHIGYTNWQEPRRNTMPAVETIDVPEGAAMGVAVEGSTAAWPNAPIPPNRDTTHRKESRAISPPAESPTLPELSVYNQEPRWIEVFNRGREPFDYAVKVGRPWLRVSDRVTSGISQSQLGFRNFNGNVDEQQRLWVTADWDRVPAGQHRVPITVAGPNGATIVVEAVVNKPKSPAHEDAHGFVESNGYVSIEAENFSRAVDAKNRRGLSPFAQSSEQKGTVPLSDGGSETIADAVRWQVIPDLGRTLSGVTSLPSTAPSNEPSANSPRLEYEVDLASAGEVTVLALVAPTLNFHNNEGLRYAISFDDQPPQIVNVHAGENMRLWEKWVADNVNETRTNHKLDTPGAHTLKFWRVDPGIVLEKVIIHHGKLPASYLGPPESPRSK
jgi:hypothetical protein